MSPFFLSIYLVFGGTLGGLLSAIAGMAPLAAYPVLLSVGIPPVYINTTNDAALIWTGVGSTASSLKELKSHWKQVSLYSIFTAIGSVLGCMLLVQFPGKIFEKIVPLCITFSGLTILFSGGVHLGNKSDHPSRLVQALSLLCLLIAGTYAGYFDTTSGALTLAILNAISDDTLLTVNIIKNIIGVLPNLVALVIYMFIEKIYRNAATPLVIGALIGSYLGPRIMRHIPVKIIRLSIAVLVLIQVTYFACTAYK